jgi:[ribosomal protein S5]-alanine N-acetyltransferase
MIDELQFIGADCPFCRMRMDFMADLAGTAQGCPNCGQSLIVPRQDGQPADKLPIPFETPRLVLRRLEAGDWSNLAPYLSDEASLSNTRYHCMDEDELSEWIRADSARRLTDAGQTIHLAIEIKDEQALLGHVDLQLTDLQHVLLSFQPILNRHTFRHELGVEAFGGLLVFAFRQLNLHRIASCMLAGNLEVENCLQAVGMKQEGLFRKDQLVDWASREWRDSVVYAMLREDYQGRLGA